MNVTERAAEPERMPISGETIWPVGILGSFQAVIVRHKSCFSPVTICK